MPSSSSASLPPTMIAAVATSHRGLCPASSSASSFVSQVVSHNCVACPLGKTNVKDDNASGPDTTCDATLCAANQRVANNACVACPSGSTNDAGDDASQGNTYCQGQKTCHGTAAGATCMFPFQYVPADTKSTPQSYNTCTRAMPPPRSNALAKDDLVRANWQGRGTWYNGKIQTVRAGDQYDVKYDDGDSETNVPGSRIVRIYADGVTGPEKDAWCKTDSSGKWGKCSCGQCDCVHHCVGGCMSGMGGREWAGEYSQICTSGTLA